MKELSIRQSSLIKLLTENTKEMTSQSLTRLLTISSRTLRYEIKNINQIFNNTIIASNKNGYFIVNKTSITDLFKNVKINDFQESKRMITITLLNNELINIYDLEEQCYVSSSTIMNIIKEINDEFSIYSISFQRKGDYIYTIALEENKRAALASFIQNQANVSSIDILYFDHYFTHFNLENLQGIVMECLEELQIEIDYIYLKNIIINLAVALQRILDGYSIEVKELNEEEIRKSSEYLFIKNFADKVNKKFSILIKAEDFVCMKNSIAGSFIDKNKNELETILSDTAFTNKIKNILNNTFDHFRLTVDYTSFFENFVFHVHYLLIRSRSFSFFENDIFHNLKSTHPYIHSVAVYITYLIEKTFIVKISTDEIGLIAIYLGNVIDDIITYDYAKVICIFPNYTALGNKFLLELKNKLNQIEFIKTVSTYHQIPKDLEYDFIISTVKNEYILDNVLYVSPLITPREIRMIEKKSMEVFKRNKAKVIAKHLLSHLDEDLFFYNAPYNKDKEILQLIFNQLVQSNIASMELYEDIIRREEISSTVYYSKFAISHSLNCCSKENKVVYFYHEKPFRWFNEKINLLLVLPTTNFGEDFSHIFKVLFDTLSDNDFYLSLTRNKSYKELITYLKSILK